MVPFQNQQKNLTLQATKAGIILTTDLDLRRNQELKPGEDFLLEIADLTELTATVEIKQEDLELPQRHINLKFPLPTPHSPLPIP